MRTYLAVFGCGWVGAALGVLALALLASPEMNWWLVGLLGGGMPCLGYLLGGLVGLHLTRDW